MTQSKVTVELDIDWELLHKQKMQLIEIISLTHSTDAYCELEGLVALIDSIQDQAEDQGHPVYQHLEGKDNL